MKVLGLTGGIGMGKSTAAACLRERGIAVVDSDDLARQVVAPGQPALEEIRTAFGPTVLAADGRLLRQALARIVFADDSARRRLEAITHPRIRQLWQARIREWRSAGLPQATVVVPLLFEIQAQAEFDATLCIACSARSQRQRLLARGWSAGQIQQRLRAQWPADRKMALADYVVWTEGDPGVLGAQLDRVLAGICGAR